MKKIKKIAIFIPLMILLICSLAGCAKVVKTEESTVQVKITDEYYQNAYMTSVYNGKSFTFVPHPATYRITVQYNGEEYSVSGEAVYAMLYMTL